MCYNKVLKRLFYAKGLIFMKKLVKILALTLCIASLFSLVSCTRNTEEGTPEGMINATTPGSYYRLYVPSTWTPNTAYGVSGAYATLSHRSNVSVAKYPAPAMVLTSTMPEELRNAEIASAALLDWFYQTECLASIKALTYNTAVEVPVETPATTLGGCNARRYCQKGQVDGKELYFTHVVTQRISVEEGTTSAPFYVFSFTIDTVFEKTEPQLYATLLANVESMLSAFVFSEDPYLPDNYLKSIDEAAPAPEGMKLASNDEVAYLFYVPSDWTINRDERIFSAYHPADRSSVSVIPYMPDSAMSVPQLWEMTEKSMKETAGDGYGLIEADTTSRFVGGKPTHAYRYFYTVGGQRYDYYQVILVHGDKLYSITYTALPEHFYDHLNEVESILSNLVFR